MNDDHDSEHDDLPDDGLIDEDALTAEELAEAAALARALERGHAEEALPEDAFQTAALLQFSHDGAELDAARADAILEDVFAEAKVRRPEKAPWWRWLVPVSLAGAAATAAVLLMLRSAPDAMPLPRPDGALLQAQATAAATPTEGAGAELDRAMGAYRGQVLAALEDRYR